MCLHLLHIKNINFYYWLRTHIEYRLLYSALGAVNQFYAILVILKMDVCQIIRKVIYTGNMVEMIIASHSSIMHIHGHHPSVFWKMVYYVSDTIQRVAMLNTGLKYGVTSILGLVSTTAQYHHTLGHEPISEVIFKVD